MAGHKTSGHVSPVLSLVPTETAPAVSVPADIAAISTSLPQDPFLPKFTFQGPAFLDTGACLCALRPFTDGDEYQTAWRCQGNSTDNIYYGNSGKWYPPSLPSEPGMEMNDGSNPPKNNETLIYTESSRTLQPLMLDDQHSLSVFDQACTGINDTTFSTSLYRAAAEVKAGETPIDGAPCWRVGALPILIQDSDAWQISGCAKGFFCPNNTINSLPQYCYPLEPCAKSRLAGATCQWPRENGLNVPMGPFEPVMCTSGYYCPVGAKEQLKCPAGSYCPPGSVKPIPCHAGSRCPEGSQNETSFVPFTLLLILDLAILTALLIVRLRSRGRMGKKRRHDYLPKSIRLMDLKEKKAGYETLEEGDNVALESVIQPIRRVPTGFQAALDQHYLQENNNAPIIDIDASIELKHFVESMRKAIQGNTFGLSVEYRDLSYHPRGSTKPILSQVSGNIANGSLVGVMGGSGAGKSTFVNVLMGKATHTGGMVKVNGVASKMKSYKKAIGYVPQDDIVLPELTVRENILHSARIRLPSTWSDREIQYHADAVIDCLDLAHVKYSKVGTISRPIISGGQRKRVSIGMELAAAPMALFLDEPTSGLDATSASSVMKTLKALSKLGISIIVIVHQPRIEIFELIDDLILLGDGRLLFQGKEAEVEQYFKNLGFHFPENCNIADVITDIITGNGRQYKRTGEISKEALISHWAAIMASKEPRVASPRPEPANVKAPIRQRGAPWFRQVYFCLIRAMLQQYRAKSSFWFEMGVAAFGGFLIGLAQNGQKGVNFRGFFLGDYGILSSSVDYQSVPMMALLVCISIGLIASAPGVRVFGEEYLVARREASSGHNQFAYYIAKVLSTIPRLVIACFHFTTFFILLCTPVIPWSASFAANLLYFYCIYGLASVVSMIVRQTEGPLFAVMASLIVGVLSGAAPPLRNVASWHMEWLWRSSPGVWLAEIYFGRNVAPLAYLYDVKGASIITGYKLDHYSMDLAALFVIGTIYRVLAFGAMLLFGRLRR